MAGTNYTGNPAATQPPSPPPDLNGTAPIINIPDDGDPLVVASVWQAFKALADFIAFIAIRIGGLILGVRSVKALQVDGTGDQVVAPASGTIQCSGSIVSGSTVQGNTIRPTATLSGTSVPTPAFTTGTGTKDLIPWAIFSFGVSGGVLTFIRGIGVSAISRSSAGVYSVTLANSMSSPSTAMIFPVITSDATTYHGINASMLSGTSLAVTSFTTSFSAADFNGSASVVVYGV